VDLLSIIKTGKAKERKDREDFTPFQLASVTNWWLTSVSSGITCRESLGVFQQQLKSVLNLASELLSVTKWRDSPQALVVTKHYEGKLAILPCN